MVTFNFQKALNDAVEKGMALAGVPDQPLARLAILMNMRDDLPMTMEPGSELDGFIQAIEIEILRLDPARQN